MKTLFFIFTLSLAQLQAASLDGLTWESSEGVITITDCDPTASGALDIPSQIEGNPVSIIGNYAFYLRANLTSINLPDTITRIGAGAFDGCVAAEGIEVPKNLNFLGQSAFRNCAKLVSVIIPESLTSIGNGAFSYCPSLRTINPVENHPTLRSIDGVLFDKEVTTIVQYPGGKIDPHYEIPETITSFEGYGCFATNPYLERITIPESLHVIGDWAFSFCSNLREINFPQSLQVTGWVSFSDCTSLQTVTIPANVETINNGTFTNCTSLSRVVFEGPATDPKWGGNAFRNIGDSPYALVKPEHAESFGGVGAIWRGLEVRIGPVDPPTPPTFAETALEQGLTGESALPNSDPGQRGVSNGIAYALGLPLVGPLTPENRKLLPLLTTDSTEGSPQLTISIPGPPPADVTYLIMTSQDLIDWREIGQKGPGASWAGEITVDETPQDARVITTFTPTDAAIQNGSAFLQLKVVIE